MKKNRFKNWLIHKLGGYTKDEYDFIIKKPIKYNVVNIKLETIKARKYIDDYEIHNIDYPIERQITAIKNDLKLELLNIIEPEYILEQGIENQKTMIAKIELPSKYVKWEEK